MEHKVEKYKPKHDYPKKNGHAPHKYSQKEVGSFQHWLKDEVKDIVDEIHEEQKATGSRGLSFDEVGDGVELDSEEERYDEQLQNRTSGLQYGRFFSGVEAEDVELKAESGQFIRPQ